MGVDVAEERKGLDLVALDSDRRVIARSARATVADVAALVADLRPDVVCIDSPPAWAIGGRSRSAERELRQLGITAFATPTDPGPHPFYRWMRVGFSMFGAIIDDYPRFRAGAVRGTAIEVFPEASAVLLKGRLRSKAESKSQFRRGVLTSRGVDHTDLRSGDAVDAAVASLTGLLALKGEFSTVGTPDEGVIVLPVAALPSAPLIRPAPSMEIEPALAPDIPASGWPSGGERTCMCGCRAIVRRRFLPGHDAKLKSRLLRLRASGDVGAASELRALGWVEDDRAAT